jgi:trans-2,3-dihydro-3-hydroxyanthranilate isomerase
VHAYTLLDVFAEAPLAGNGLAVVHDADDVSDAVMLAFARETRLAETTFVQTSRAAAADYRNRIWTITEEVPFAGHPSLGTAVAVGLRRGEREVTYVQETRVGLQEVEVRRDGDRAWASVLQEPATLGDEFDPGRLMAAAGLTAADAHPTLPPQMVSTGLPTLVAPVASRDAIARARPDRDAVAALDPSNFNFYLFWQDPCGGEARARSIPSRQAEAEDPATGSAAGPLLAYLHARTGLERLEIAQGIEIERPSRLVAELEGERVRVGGHVIVIATGELRLP